MLAALRERWLTFSRQASTTKLWLQASPCQRLSVSGLPGSAAAPAISVPLPLTSSQIDQEKSAACSPMISRKNNGQQVGHCHNHSSFLCFPLIPGALFISNRNLFYINFTPSDRDLLGLFPSRLKKKKGIKTLPTVTHYRLWLTWIRNERLQQSLRGTGCTANCLLWHRFAAAIATNVQGLQCKLLYCRLLHASAPLLVAVLRQQCKSSSKGRSSSLPSIVMLPLDPNLFAKDNIALSFVQW